MSKTVVRPLVVAEQLLGVAQKVVPVMSGTWDRQLELSQLQPSEAVVTHLNRATLLRLGLVILHHDLLVLPTEVRVATAGGVQPAALRWSDSAEQIQRQQRQSYWVLLCTHIENLPTLVRRQDIRIEPVSQNLVHLVQRIGSKNVLLDEPVAEGVDSDSVLLPHLGRPVVSVGKQPT